jgi:hypothetical protein
MSNPDNSGDHTGRWDRPAIDAPENPAAAAALAVWEIPRNPRPQTSTRAHVFRGPPRYHIIMRHRSKPDGP